MPFKIMPVLDSDLNDPGDPRNFYPQRVSVSKKGMAATSHYLATEAAQEIMSEGGNAVDAAIAAAFALAVAEPAASGLGGQSMLMLYDPRTKRKLALDGSSRAPHRIVPGQKMRKDLYYGHQAATVPSTPAVLAYALKKYGTLNLQHVLQPAIRLAETGCRITPLHYFLVKREMKRLRAGSAAALFLQENNHPYPMGAVFRQPALAKTLKRVAEYGVEDFYKGKIARSIHEDMAKHGGLICQDDLAQIPWPVERRPLSAHFQDMRLFTCGPPGAGRTLIEALNILNHFPKSHWNPDTPEGALLLANVLRKANLDRADKPADPALFAQEMDLNEDITNPDYAQRVAKRIKQRIHGHGDTTHLSVMDRKGFMVGITQSIERVFGSFEASPQLGFLYNNYMSAFEYEDMSHPYYLRPGAVPWASVAPSLVFKGRQPWLVLGSPGSQRIVSAIVQVLVRLALGASPYAAVEAPRLHVSIKGEVSLEASRIRDDVAILLQKRGFTINRRDPYSFYLGSVQLVLRDEQGNLIGAADPRRDGSAGGIS